MPTPGDLATLGQAAYDRGLYRDAAQLDKKATAHGDPYAAARLVSLLHRLHPGDPRPARWAVGFATLANPHDVAWLLGALRNAGASEQVSALLARDPAAHASLDDPLGVAYLLDTLRGLGAVGHVTTLLDRDPATDASLEDPAHVAELLCALGEAGARAHTSALIERLPSV